MVEWLERLDYVAESRRKAGFRHATTGKLSVNPAVNGYILRFREG